MQQMGTMSQNYDTVAFLDLDPGQPEFSPPGELSLLKLKAFNLGPPFTHPTTYGDKDLIRAHHFGYLSPKDDPHHYYQCAQDLYSHYRQMGICPLIVNCSGWVQGSGLELLTDLVNGLNLTDVIYMSTTGPEEVVSALEEATTRRDIPLHQLTSQVSDFPTRTAADLRMMSTMSYFHIDGFEIGDIRWNASPLTTIAPVVVHYAGPSQAILAVMVVGDEQSPEFYSSLLEGCIVGIAVVEQGSAHSVGSNEDFDSDIIAVEAEDISIQGDDLQRLEQKEEQYFEPGTILRSSDGIPYICAKDHSVRPLPPASSHSLGQAIVRGIDTVNKTFHLLTPIPSERFQAAHRQNQKIMLVRARLDTPTWAYSEQAALEKGRRLRRERESGEKETYGPDDVRAWAETQPWASFASEGRTGSGKARRVRRDIRYRSQGLGNADSGQ